MLTVYATSLHSLKLNWRRSLNTFEIFEFESEIIFGHCHHHYKNVRIQRNEMN